jgi:hypothetical protein
MDTSEVPGDINHDRRRFLGVAGAAALAVGVTQLGRIGSATAQTGRVGSARLAAAGLAAASTAFGPVKQIDAGVLNVGYVDAGPADARPVILLHGFPYDIHSFVEVAPLLAARGYRVIVPYMRGHGTPPGDGALYRAHFTDKYGHRTFDVGHNVPQEAPQAFAQTVVDVDRF